MSYISEQREQEMAWDMIAFSKRVKAESDKRKSLCARGTHRFKLLSGHTWVDNCIRCNAPRTNAESAQ